MQQNGEDVEHFLSVGVLGQNREKGGRWKDDRNYSSCWGQEGSQIWQQAHFQDTAYGLDCQDTR